MHTTARHCLLTICFVLFCACAKPRPDAQNPATAFPPIPTLRPTAALAATPVIDTTNTSDTGWITGSTGVELRKLRLDLGERPVLVSIVRLDPAQVRLRVGYTPETPQTFDTWTKQTVPLMLVNGGFFDETYQTTALLVSDGVASGASYQGFGGMLTVGESGEVAIQPLRDQPYDPAQAPRQAMQSFPMLVFPGGADSGVEWNSDRDRRTALAIDQTGHLLIIVCPQSSFSLNEFATWLQQGDLEIERALNLDGGASTGLYVNAGAAQERIEPFSRLPIVLFAEART